MMKQEANTQTQSFFLLDSSNITVARGQLVGPFETTFQVKVLDDKISDVMRHEQIRLVSLSGSVPVMVTKVVRCRNSVVVLEKLYNDKRKNLRVPTDFKSFIYPLDGRWKGRRVIQANDISCDGLVFFYEGELGDKEQMEVVVPVTSNPLILRCEVLRKRPSDRDDTTLYALQFVDMCDDEEMVVREAVFSIQLQNRGKVNENFVPDDDE